MTEQNPRRPVRVDLSALTMVPGGMGGTETYFWGLVGAFDASDGLELTARMPSNVSRSLGDVRRGPDGPPTESSTFGRLLTSGRLLLSRRAGAGHHGAEIVHYPFTVPLPRPARPHVLTLHDVQHLAMPEHFSAAERTYRRWAYDAPARRAHAVITDSEFSKAEIVHRLGVPSERVHAIHLGVEADVVPLGRPRENFLLYPARRWPHKNHARLLDAVRLVREEMPGLRLVLTGGGAPLDGAPDWVEQRGLVTRVELLDLYARAGCLVFPSLYEGFGLPPIEAMAAGCPVAVSDRGSLPEVCGDVAESFDPLDVPAMARAIRHALVMSPSRIAAAVARAQRFTWRRAAEQHAAVFRQVSSAARSCP